MCIGSLSRLIILTHTKTQPRTDFHLLALACWSCLAWLHQILKYCENTNNSVGVFLVQNWVIRARFSTLLAIVVPAPEKVSKSQVKHFSTVLTRNDTSCDTNCVGIFRVQTGVIWAPFSALHAPSALGGDKVVNIQLKHFLAVLMANDKNCIPNSVGIFWVQNRVILARLWTYAALGIYKCLKKSSKFDWNIFQPY